MKDFATLLQAIASLLWPLFAFTALFVFRKQIADLAARLRKGKLLGQEIELSESLDMLQKSAESVETEIAALPRSVDDSIPAIRDVASERNDASEKDVERRIIDEASRSPKAALISLASELEKLAIELLATSGHLKGRKLVPIQQAITEFHRIYGLPNHVTSSLRYFWEVRDRLIHRGEGTDEDLLRAIDSGLSILRALQAMPRELNYVYATEVPVFSDSALSQPITTVKGVILETHSAGGLSKTLRIFPTTKTHFKKGKQVSWEWNLGLVTGQAWYRDPRTGEPAQAWGRAAEFVGRHLDEL